MCKNTFWNNHFFKFYFSFQLKVNYLGYLWFQYACNKNLNSVKMKVEKLHKYCRTAFTVFYYTGAFPFRLAWVPEAKTFQIVASSRIAYYSWLFTLIIITIHYFFIVGALVVNLSGFIQNKAYLEITFHGFWVLCKGFQFQYGIFHFFKLIEIQTLVNGTVSFILGLQRRMCSVRNLFIFFKWSTYFILKKKCFLR